MRYLANIQALGRDANPFFRLMGIELGSYGEGEAVLFMPVRPDMLNGVGWLQGGLYSALCDEAMALFTVLEEEEDIATISESTSFLQGIKKGCISAQAKVVKKGRRVAFVEGRVTSRDDGTPLSLTQASFAIIPRRSSRGR
ncbi:PaaI family thioesterase [Methanothrix soehngenii]|uniref:PaaI family thioesterase n=1 Tax=Methanothrix soehngenii TaxID=2223 RepID=UPI0023549F7D|nr:PaaI family thioesterase [Methanothrix soehngenii]